MLRPIIDGKINQRAFETLQATLWRDARLYVQHPVGWQGGGDTCDVYWRARDGFWSVLAKPRDIERFWCCFGTADPGQTPMLHIDVEINPPHQGVDRRVAGSFLQDGAGSIYLAHSGKIGGGHKGVGKHTFLQFYRGGNWQDVRWPDGSTSETIVLGRIDIPELAPALAQFVREVAEFKKWIRAGQGAEQSRKPPDHTFNPEFSGTKRFSVSGRVEAECLHGVVVSAIAKVLEGQGLKVANDRNRDLMTIDAEGHIAHLFEVKTCSDLTSIYTAVGQLLLHSVRDGARPKTTLVLPEPLDAEIRARLTALDISVMTYAWRGTTPVFKGIHAGS